MPEKYKDASLSFEERADDLVGRMMLEEKISQTLYASSAIPRLGIPEYNWWNECLHGVARAGVATMFPQAIGMAASFDDELMHDVAAAISDEARAKHHEAAKYEDRGIYKGLTMWSPNINIFRDPRWGRGHETYGEDPYLTARMGKAFVGGLQGADKKYLKTMATVKHYAVHSGPEADRHRFDAKASVKDMRETYLPAFKECVKEAGAYSVMGAYNRTNGEACCASPTLMDGFLRGEWGFDGYYVSDCGAIDDFHEHHRITKDGAGSAALAIREGCDLNCGCTFEKLLDAVKRGLVTEAQIDVSVKRLMLARLKLGMFDPPDMVPYAKIPYDAVCCPRHLELSHEMARRSLVLLKNNGILPLDGAKIGSVAVIGPNADNRRALWGNYYGTAAEQFTVLDGIRASLPDARIRYAPGCTHLGMPAEGSWGEKYTWGMAEAMAAAARSDAVVLALGLDERFEGEEGEMGGDKRSIALPQAQVELFDAVLTTGKPVILVMMTGSPVDMTPFAGRAAAILQAWYPGQFGGLAVAEALLGQVNPSGRLPVTFYKDDASLPDFTDYSMEGRTYKFLRGEPGYPFGYGLSYTSFEYGGVRPQAPSVEAGKPVKVASTVRNTGKRAGGEVVQLYLTDVEASTRTPRWQLADFRRIELQPGEQREISFEIPARRMCVITDDGRTVLEPGRFRVYLGGSQPDALSARLTGRKPLEAEFEITGKALEMEY
jgi:beta-glucosidase